MKTIFTGLMLLLFLMPCIAGQPKLIIKLSGIHESIHPVFYRYEIIASGNTGKILAGSYRMKYVSLSAAQIALLVKKVQAVNWNALPQRVGKFKNRLDFTGKLQVEYATGGISKQIPITIGTIKDRALWDLLRTMMTIPAARNRLWHVSGR